MTQRCNQPSQISLLLSLDQASLPLFPQLRIKVKVARQQPSRQYLIAILMSPRMVVWRRLLRILMLLLSVRYLLPKRESRKRQTKGPGHLPSARSALMMMMKFKLKWIITSSNLFILQANSGLNRYQGHVTFCLEPTSISYLPHIFHLWKNSTCKEASLMCALRKSSAQLHLFQKRSFNSIKTLRHLLH